MNELYFLQSVHAVLAYMKEIPGLQDEISIQVAPSYAGFKVKPIVMGMSRV